jgi:hypothetical protein
MCLKYHGLSAPGPTQSKLETVRDYHYFCRFELENVSIYHGLPALGLTRYVHAKRYIEMHRGVKFYISEISLIWLEKGRNLVCIGRHIVTELKMTT